MYTKYRIENNSAGIYITLIDESREFSSDDRDVAKLLNIEHNEYEKLFEHVGYIEKGGCYFNSFKDAEKFCELLIIPALILNKFSS